MKARTSDELELQIPLAAKEEPNFKPEHYLISHPRSLFSGGEMSPYELAGTGSQERAGWNEGENNSTRSKCMHLLGCFLLAAFYLSLILFTGSPRSITPQANSTTPPPSQTTFASSTSLFNAMFKQNRTTHPLNI